MLSSRLNDGYCQTDVLRRWAFIEVRNAAVRGIAVKDYPPEAIANWAGPPVTEATLERLFVNSGEGNSSRGRNGGRDCWGGGTRSCNE